MRKLTLAVLSACGLVVAAIAYGGSPIGSGGGGGGGTASDLNCTGCVSSTDAASNFLVEGEAAPLDSGAGAPSNPCSTATGVYRATDPDSNPATDDQAHYICPVAGGNWLRFDADAEKLNTADAHNDHGALTAATLLDWADHYDEGNNVGHPKVTTSTTAPTVSTPCTNDGAEFVWVSTTNSLYVCKTAGGSPVWLPVDSTTYSVALEDTGGNGLGSTDTYTATRAFDRLSYTVQNFLTPTGSGHKLYIPFSNGQAYVGQLRCENWALSSFDSGDNVCVGVYEVYDATGPETGAVDTVKQVGTSEVCFTSTSAVGYTYSSNINAFTTGTRGGLALAISPSVDNDGSALETGTFASGSSTSSLVLDFSGGGGFTANKYQYYSIRLSAQVGGGTPRIVDEYCHIISHTSNNNGTTETVTCGSAVPTMNLFTVAPLATDSWSIDDPDNDYYVNCSVDVYNAE